MPTLGAHVSVAGGLAKGAQRARDLGCSCVQIFTKNNNRWAAKPLTEEAIASWKAAVADAGLVAPIAHASYLINLASPDDQLFGKSVDALVIEMERANALALDGLVVHPGAFTKSSEPDGIARVIAAVSETLQRVPAGSCRLLLENTAGQGTCLGHSFGQLARMLEGIGWPDRLGICFDTCHAYAAGYELNRETEFAAMRREMDDLLPAGAVRALHLNDSKKPLGSRVDRHEHIGRGEIGPEGFRLVLADPVLGRLPGYLETEKGIDQATGEDWDKINLAALRRVAAE